MRRKSKSYSKLGGNATGINPIRASTLEEIVKERKSEARKKAEQKRLEGVQLIERLNQPNSEGRHALQILPEEMWKLILDELADPHDLNNARKSCALFEKILEPRRIRDILLPLALEIDEFRTSLLHKITTPGRKIITTRRALLSLRETCMSLRDLVDRCYDAVLLQFGASANRQRFLADLPILKLREVRPFPGIILPFRDPASSTTIAPRLVGRSVFIIWDVFFEEGNYRDIILSFDANFSKLLEVLGDQIWFFRFDAATLRDLVSRWGFTLVDLYSMIGRWIRRMPNLRFLELDFIGIYYVWTPPSPALKELEQNIKNHPLPRLEHLLKLRLSFLDRVAPAAKIYEEVLRSNPHVRSFGCRGLSTFSEETKGFIGRVSSLPLDSLSLTCVRNTQDFRWANPSWPLNQVSLTLFSLFEADMEQVFAFLQQYQSLDKVSLRVSRPVVRGNGKGVYLRLPKLKEFEFVQFVTGASVERVPWFHTSIDYLLKAEGLEKLTWLNWRLKARGDYMEDPQALVKFNAGKGNLAECNVWRVFPNLKSVQVPDYENQRPGSIQGKIWWRGEIAPRINPCKVDGHFQCD